MNSAAPSPSAALQPSRVAPDAFDPGTVDVDALYEDLKALREELDASLGEEDLIARFVRLSKAAAASEQQQQQSQSQKEQQQKPRLLLFSF